MPLVSSTWAGSHVQLKPEPKSQHWPSFMPRIADATVGAVSQRFPSVPDGQAQKKSPSKLMQLALFRHGLFAPLSGPSCFFFKNQIEYKEADQKSNKLLPGGQVHLKLLIISVKVSPLRQGETGAHWLILFSQRAPVNPGRTGAEGRVGLGQAQSAVPAESFFADQRPCWDTRDRTFCSLAAGKSGRGTERTGPIRPFRSTGGDSEGAAGRLVSERGIAT